MIYRLRADTDKYFSFDISAYDINYMLGDFFLLDKPFWAEFWKPMHGTFFDAAENQQALSVPDVTVWFAYNCLALNQKAYEKLKSHLEKFGEILPVQCEKIPYWLFHSTVRTGIECVDAEHSARTTDESGHVEMQALMFNEKSLNNELVFQTEYNNFRNMYCTEEFKSLVEGNGLKGIDFNTDLACEF